MKTHILKCWHQYFEQIIRGEKTFETRYDDRDYKKGDLLVLREYNALDGTYSGRETHMRVGYIWRDFGMLPGWVVMGIEPIGTARL